MTINLSPFWYRIIFAVKFSEISVTRTDLLFTR